MSARRWGLALAWLAVGAAAAVAGCDARSRLSASTDERAAGAPIQGFEVVNVYPHDSDAFTQGLVFADGILYESTGRWGLSTLRKVELESGRVLEVVHLPDNLFGEGIALHGDRVVMLTWRSRTGFVYDRESFQLIRSFSYPREGWGLTHDGERLIMSDGSATLYHLDPLSYVEVGRLPVTDGGRPVSNLNELEYVGGEIYANVLGKTRIARIDAASGRVVAWIDLETLPGEETGVLNGIAHHAQTGHLLVTGKLWSRLFEIRLQPVSAATNE